MGFNPSLSHHGMSSAAGPSSLSKVSGSYYLFQPVPPLCCLGKVTFLSLWVASPLPSQPYRPTLTFSKGSVEAGWFWGNQQEGPQWQEQPPPESNSQTRPGPNGLGYEFGLAVGLLPLFQGDVHMGTRGWFWHLGRIEAVRSSQSLISGLDAHASWEGHTGGWTQAMTPIPRDTGSAHGEAHGGWREGSVSH